MERNITLLDQVNNSKSTIAERILARNLKIYETLDTGKKKRLVPLSKMRISFDLPGHRQYISEKTLSNLI